MAKRAGRPDAQNPRFEGPPAPENGSEQRDDLSETEDAAVDFTPPEEGTQEALAVESPGFTGELGLEEENLLQLRTQIEEQLLARASRTATARVQAEDIHTGEGNIVGVGFGFSNADVLNEQDASLSAPPGSYILNLYVAEPMTVEQAKAVLVDHMSVQGVSDDNVPVNVVVTGVFDAQPHRFRIRPAPGGVSVGHYKITAGTLGCLARGRIGPRRNRLFVLSNNHVLANSNAGTAGDPILQPGPYDGGRNPADRIAVLERFVQINFSGGVNYVDCATGWADPNLVRKELIYLKQGQPQYFRISSTVLPPQVGMEVGKSGRTTQLTTGRIIDISATVTVNYGGGRVGLYKDQILVQGIQGAFSDGGDSGSVVWTNNRTRNPVGLLFAGSTTHTICNKMARVLQALDITLYT